MIYSEVINKSTQIGYTKQKRYRIFLPFHIWPLYTLLWISQGIKIKHPGYTILLLTIIDAHKLLIYMRASLTIPQKYFFKVHDILLDVVRVNPSNFPRYGALPLYFKDNLYPIVVEYYINGTHLWNPDATIFSDILLYVNYYSCYLMCHGSDVWNLFCAGPWVFEVWDLGFFTRYPFQTLFFCRKKKTRNNIFYPVKKDSACD